MADADTGMDKSDMKKMLMVSKKQPVNCAVGMTKTGVVLMMDKIKQPKAVLKELEKKFADMKQPHWGSAVVDMETDPKLVVLTLNKAAPGMARRMRKTLKGTGFSKVEIRLEDGTVADKGDEDEEEVGALPAAARPGAPGEAAAPAASPAPDGADGPAADAAPSPSAAAAPLADQAAPQAGQDAAALTRQLTGLVGQVKGALASDPSHGDALKGLATQAQASLKSGDLQGAHSAITELQHALGQASAANGGAQPGAGAAAPNVQALGKAKLAWSATRTKVEGELDKLHGEMWKHYREHGFGFDLEKTFASRIQPMMTKLDDTLSKKLDEVTGADPAQHTKLVGEAKQILQQYSAYLTQEPMIAKLDSNPFVPVTIQKTLSATLSALDCVVA